MESQEEEYQCSDCGATVLNNAIVCPKCGAFWEESPEEDSFEEICIPSDLISISNIQSLLEDNKIEYSIENNSLDSVFGLPLGQSQKILVRKNQTAKVYEILQNLENDEIKLLDDNLFSLDKKKEITLKGVEGWLLFFCLTLLLGPIAYLTYSIDSYIEFQDELNWFPLKDTILYIDLVSSVLISGFSIYAGYNLWRINSHAIKSTNFYLNAFLIYSVLFFFTIIFIFSNYNIPFSGISQMMFGEIFEETLSSITFVVIWKLYLKNSERVKNTYCVSNWTRTY